jgi:hypothetical protein
MTIKHKCGNTTVENQAKVEHTQRSSYNEYDAMHGDGDGWIKWTETNYIVEKCVKCGKRHTLKQHELK